jgi:hypothetical protein
MALKHFWTIGVEGLLYVPTLLGSRNVLATDSPLERLLSDRIFWPAYCDDFYMINLYT